MLYLLIIILSIFTIHKTIHAMEDEWITQYRLPPQEHLNRDLMDAVKDRNLKHIRDCLQRGAQVNKPCSIKSRTPLIEVCDLKVENRTNKKKVIRTQKEIIALLLEFKADPDCRDALSLSAPDYAAKRNNPTILEQLLNAGAQLIGRYPTTPCHVAAFYSAHDTLQLLHARGATMNEVDKVGFAPIHHVLHSPNALHSPSTLNLLLQYEARLDHQTQASRSRKKVAGNKKLPVIYSSPFHMVAQLHNPLHEGHDQPEKLTHIKKILLYHALFYGNMDYKNALCFLACIRQCAPALYSLRNQLLIPGMCQLKPRCIMDILHSEKYEIRRVAVQTLIYRTQQLCRILLLKDDHGQTAYDIEKLYIQPDNQAFWPLFNPETLNVDCKAFIEAAGNNCVTELSESNALRAAWSLLQAHEKTTKTKCVIC